MHVDDKQYCMYSNSSIEVHNVSILHCLAIK